MYCYFSADFNSALKINGIYKGKLTTSQNLFTTQNSGHKLSDNEPDFVEIYPLNSNNFAVGYLLDDEFYANPPENVIVVDLIGGYLINFKSPCIICPFELIAQKRFTFALATVFKENGLKICIENQNDMLAHTLDRLYSECEIFEFSLDSKNLIAIHLKGERNLLLCYLIEQKITKVFCREVDEFNFENGFTTKEHVDDIAGHTIICEWELQSGNLCVKNKQVLSKEEFSLHHLNPKVLGYALLEELLLGGNAQDYLSPALVDKSQFLHEYFGELIGVFPPPFFHQQNKVGALYKSTPNKYYAKYFYFECENNKICNIKRSN